MNHYDVDFEFPGKNCTVLKITQIEKTLGKKLPKPIGI